MSLKALLTTALLIGSSTAALARPYPTATVSVAPVRAAVTFTPPRATVTVAQPRATVVIDNHRDVDPGYFRGRDRDDRDRDDRERHEWRPIQSERVFWPGRAPAFQIETPPVTVFEQTPVGAPCAFENGSETISLGGALGTRVELLSSGSTYVSKAVYTYANGHSGTVPINQYVDGNSPIAFAVKANGIMSVTLYGSGSPISATVY